jgi:DNA-directed RNA polymerase subunit RPC12/RpoP
MKGSTVKSRKALADVMAGICVTCGVPFVLIRMDQACQLATYQCPVCGYLINIRLSSEVIEPARKPPLGRS